MAQTISGIGRLRHLMLTAFFVLNGSLGDARQASRPWEFEVASIKRNMSPDGSVFGGCHSPGAAVAIPVGRCIFRGASVRTIIAHAYGFRPMSAGEFLQGEPGWVNTERYDIEAKASDDAATLEQLTTMLRSLLAAQFSLRLHEATKEVRGYALTVSKRGSRVTVGDGKTRGGIALSDSSIKVNNATMAVVAERLSRTLGSPVIDMTGLPGLYTFAISFAKDMDDTTQPAIFTAFEDQLGLRFEDSEQLVSGW